MTDFKFTIRKYGIFDKKVASSDRDDISSIFYKIGLKRKLIKLFTEHFKEIYNVRKTKTGIVFTTLSRQMGMSVMERHEVFIEKGE